MIFDIKQACDRAFFDSYVQNHNEKQLTDYSIWHRFIESETKTRIYDVGVCQEESATGRMSLGLIRHRVFGNYLTSAPYGGLGGFLAENQETARALLAKSVDLCVSNNADYVQIRGTSFEFDLEDWRYGHNYGTYVITLNDEESLWKEALTATVRNQTRKGIKHGYTTRVDRSKSLSRESWRVLSLGMRELGSPFHSYAYMQNLLQIEGCGVQQVLLFDKDQKPAGVTISMIKEKKAYLLYSITLGDHKKHCGGNVLLWDTIRNLSGISERLDLGRSLAGSSHEHFKLQWGALKINYQSVYWSLQGKEIAIPSPTDSKYKFAASCWRSLPMPATKALGPYLISGIA